MSLCPCDHINNIAAPEVRKSWWHETAAGQRWRSAVAAKIVSTFQNILKIDRYSRLKRADSYVIGHKPLSADLLLDMTEARQ